MLDFAQELGIEKYMKRLFVLIMLFAGALGVPGAEASILTATFGESLDVPFQDAVPGAYIVSRANVAVPATVTFGNPGDLVSNPNNYVGLLDLSFDPSTNILTVLSTGPDNNTYDYEIITVTLSNLTFSDGDVVTGITPITDGNAVIKDVSNLSAPNPVITTSFTSNSATINYEVPNLESSQVIYINQTGFQDQFLLTLSGASSVPEPGTMVLAGLALAGIAALRRARS
jgi:hypothetical protein